MLVLSDARAGVPLLQGLKLLHRGKVRDSYEIDKERMLVCATDGISISDVVLNSLIPRKAMVLTVMSHFWFTKLEHDLDIRTHLIAAGSAIDWHLPKHLCGNPDLQARSMVVRRLEMTPIEFVVRGFLTGSGLESYRRNGSVCGHMLPEGIQDGDELPMVIDTPTTKAQEGHDLPVNAEEIAKLYPEETAISLKLYHHMSKRIRDRRGIILADTKFEFGRCKNGTVLLADEVGTPDACRFWDSGDWSVSRAQKKRIAPYPFDKQIVRNWGKGQNITTELVIPEKVITETSRIYEEILFWTIEKQLKEYQENDLGIDISKLYK